MKRTLIIILFLGLLFLPAQSQSGISQTYNDLTQAERWLVLRYFWQVPSVWLAARKARDEATQRYPTLAIDDSQRDAFRHSFWNGSMTRRLRSDQAAERWGNAHEEYPQNPPVRKAMDLFNNQAGRDVTWAARRPGPWWWPRTRFPDDDQIADILTDALNRGDLLMIEEVGGQRDPHNGRLVPTTRP